MNADTVGEKALEFGDDGATDDSGYEQTGTISGQRAEAFDASVKMVGNITELNSPTAMMVHMATWPK